MPWIHLNPRDPVCERVVLWLRAQTHPFLILRERDIMRRVPSEPWLGTSSPAVTMEQEAKVRSSLSHTIDPAERDEYHSDVSNRFSRRGTIGPPGLNMASISLEANPVLSRSWVDFELSLGPRSFFRCSRRYKGYCISSSRGKLVPD
jgi:hypothetical protein